MFTHVFAHVLGACLNPPPAEVKIETRIGAMEKMDASGWKRFWLVPCVASIFTGFRPRCNSSVGTTAGVPPVGAKLRSSRTRPASWPSADDAIATNSLGSAKAARSSERKEYD